MIDEGAAHAGGAEQVGLENVHPAVEIVIAQVGVVVAFIGAAAVTDLVDDAGIVDQHVDGSGLETVGHLLSTSISTT
jgi:hypothetical protein